MQLWILLLTQLLSSLQEENGTRTIETSVAGRNVEEDYEYYDDYQHYDDYEASDTYDQNADANYEADEASVAGRNEDYQYYDDYDEADYESYYDHQDDSGKNSSEEVGERIRAITLPPTSGQYGCELTIGMSRLWVIRHEITTEFDRYTVEEGIWVSSISKGGLAEKIGLRQGDNLFQLNFAATKGIIVQNLFNMLESGRKGSPLRLQVWNDPEGLQHALQSKNNRHFYGIPRISTLNF